jgi:hypothetical protein
LKLAEAWTEIEGLEKLKDWKIRKLMLSTFVNPACPVGRVHKEYTPR